MPPARAIRRRDTSERRSRDEPNPDVIRLSLMTKKDYLQGDPPMLRTLALASIVLCFTACASAPSSETESLAQNIYQGRGQALNCPVAQYCVTTASRISTKRMECGCNPPPAMMGATRRR
jgi:hypothetical protein